MKKFILGGLAAAAVIAPIALTAGSASAAGVARCQETVEIETVSSTEATFTVNQSKDTVGQFENVWKHVYTITVQPNGTFAGPGSVTDNGVGDPVWTETITGQFLDNDENGTSDHVTFNTVPNEGATFSVTNAPMDSSTVLVESPWASNVIEFRIAQPVFKTVSVDGVTDFANHGEYVSAMGGGKVAAQSCVGMPLKSNKVK